MILPTEGNPNAPIVVVTDAPTKAAWKLGRPIIGGALGRFARSAHECEFGQNDFYFIAPCPPIPEIAEGSEKRKTDFITQYSEQFRHQLASLSPRLIVFLGPVAGRQVTGKPVKITKVRGVAREIAGLPCPVMPMLSPNHVLKRPEMNDLFDGDFRMMRIIVDGGYSIGAAADAVGEVNYEWRTDISDVLRLARAREIQAMSLDTEGLGLKWYRPETKTLVVQFSYQPGHAIAMPVDCDYWTKHSGERMTARGRAAILGQLRELCSNADVKKCGHNIKFDHHMMLEKLGIEVRGWQLDTQLLAFFADENMLEKSQDECVRRWVPEMAGYADEFNMDPIHVGKSRMDLVPLDKMLMYGCGDADGNLRLARALLAVVRADQRQWDCYRHINFPAIRTFCDVMERNGILINTTELASLQAALDEQASTEYQELIQMVPMAVRRKHAEKGLAFSRDAFVRDILFSADGFNLKPRVFTKSTAKLPDDQRVPSVSTKDHLPYFESNPFVAKYVDYQKLAKMRSTYVGKPFDTAAKGPTGFWQYIGPDGRIHPSFMLHRTVTGRTASADPNAQNFPKRSKLAKAYRKIFVPTPGYRFIEADLSQAELRIAAWMANETTMLRIYRGGGDIHAATAARTMGIDMDAFQHLAPEVKKMKRTQAKAINFGFLYGMGWRKFMSYAKTEYKLDYTEKEAQAARDAFFGLFPRLEDWHVAMREFVKEHGYVRSLHGAIRHLPNIHSDDEMIRSECERQAINSPVQRFASDLGLIGLVRLARDADPEAIRPIAFIHDAIVCEVREDFVDEGMAACKWYMENPPLQEWFGISAPIPIVSDVTLGDNLGDMDEQEGLEAVCPSWYNEAFDLAA